MEASEITSRAEKVSSIVLAEIYHFQRERVVDFRKMMKDMLKEQIDFYTQVRNTRKCIVSKYCLCTIRRNICGKISIIPYNIIDSQIFPH